MKKLLLLILLAASTFKLYAQTTKRPDAFVSVFITRSMPSGDFYKSDIANKESGFAKSGPAFGLAYTQLFPSKTKPNKALLPGVSISLLNRNNGVDLVKLAEVKAGNASSIESIKASEYNSKFILAGFVLHNQLEPTAIDTYIRGNFGLAFNTSPRISFIYNSGKQPETQEESKSTSFAYGFDAGIRYNFGKLGLGAESTMLFTEAAF